MSPRRRKYYFGKINLYGEQIDDRSEALWAALNSAASASSSEKYRWVFYGAKRIAISDVQYYAGRLAKVTDDQQTRLVQREGAYTELDVVLPDKKYAVSRFLIHTDTGLIAYTRDGNDIGPDMFRRYFAQVVRAHFEHFFIKCDVGVVRDFAEFERQLKRFTRLEEVNVEVHVTNPAGSREYDDIEEELEDYRAYQKTQGYTARAGESLSIEDKDYFYRHIKMVADGYGTADARGQIDGEERNISSDEDQDSIFAVSDASIEDVVDRLHAKFMNIIDRMRR